MKLLYRIRSLPARLRKLLAIIRGRMLGIHFSSPNYLFKGTFSAASTIVDVGCGFDADFSLYMIQRYGVRAVGIDPTHKHIASLAELSAKTKGRFTHQQLAISATDGTLRFNESEENVSGSLLAEHRNIRNDTIKTYEVESVSLARLPERLGLPTIEYIKLDLEGAEFELIDRLTEEEILPYRQIFIEFHHHALPQYSREDTLIRARKLEALGFHSFTVDGRDFLFYR